MFSSGRRGPRPIRVRNPRTGKPDHEFSPPSPDDLRALAADLRAAQTAWQENGVAARIAVLERWCGELVRRRGAIEAALSADTGRRAIARQEVDGLIAGIGRWCGLAPELLRTGSLPSKALPHVEMIDAPVPFPLAGAITPWNFPLLLAFVDALPALLAGCAVLIKPSEVTPRFIDPVMETVASVPELHTVLRLIAGDGATGAALVPLVDVVAFTGSVATGRKVAQAAAEAFIPAFLELGGKDPAIVLDGADLERAATAILRASVIATGQACQSIERIYVQDTVFDRFVDLLCAKARAVPLTHEDPEQGILGPLIFERQAEIIEGQLKDAAARGAAVRTGGRIERHGGGLWLAPTVVTGVNHTMTLMTEETFGPVLPVMPFGTEEEAVRLANDSRYGLSAAVFAGTEEAALAVARRLAAGGISINDAGLTTVISEAEKSAFKCSGLGPSRMGPSGLTRFLRRRAFYVSRGPVMPVEAAAEGG